MGKLFKFLIKLILFIILFVIIVVVVFLIILHDSNKTTFVPSEEEINIQNVMGEGMDESIKRIATIENDSRSTSSDNYIGFTLTTEDMNNILVSVIRSKFNPDYLKDGDKDGIVSKSGLCLESIIFEEYDNNIAAKARITALGFYRSSVTLSGTPKIEGKTLKLEFEDCKLGNKMNISRKLVLSLFNKFNITFDENGNFDANTLTLSFDISSMIEEYTSSNRFTDFFTGCTYSMDYVAATEDYLGKIVLKIDTKNVFTPVVAIPSASTSYVLPTIDPLDLSATISEADFNYMLKDQLNDAEFMDPITLGANQFAFKLSNLYYELDKDEIVALMAINELNTNIIANVSIDTEKDAKGNVSQLVLKVSTFSLGNTTVEAENFFKEIRIPASVLTGNQAGIVVTGFTVNKSSSSCTVSYGLDI